MNSKKLIIVCASAAFLLLLPVFWLVSSLAADLDQFHPVAGWAVWLATGAAIIGLLWPIVQFLRLPSMPPRELWDEDSKVESDQTWKKTAHLLLDTCEDPEAAKKLRSSIRDLPNDLPQTVRNELKRRSDLSIQLRLGSMRQAAMLSFLSPHRQLDALILLWLNLKQVFVLSRCYGFKPSPRGILRLYGSVLGAALALEAFDEIAEQAVAEAASRFAGGIPVVGQTAGMIYDPLRAAAYVGFIGLLSEHLLRSELKKPDRSERRELRKKAWSEAAAEVPKLASIASATAAP